MNSQPVPTPQQQIARLLISMSEGDRARVLQFCQAIAQSRQGKREQRRKRWRADSMQQSCSTLDHE